MLPEFTTLPLRFDAPLADELFLLGRLLFGAVLAFMGLNHFLDVDAIAGYADAMGIPAARLSVLFSGGMLLFGGLGVASGAFPTLAAGALIVFLGVAIGLLALSTVEWPYALAVGLF